MEVPLMDVTDTVILYTVQIGMMLVISKSK